MKSKPGRAPDPGEVSEVEPGHQQGIRTRVLLVAAMALIIVVVTSSSLLLVRHSLLAQVTRDVSQNLTDSVATFQNLQTERLAVLEREDALLADLPSLKALMTTSDAPTIRNGAVEFWRVSGNDLFALADSQGRIVATLTRGVPVDPTLEAGLRLLLTGSGKRYLVGRSNLYACSTQPLYFGSREAGALLGYVINGIAVEGGTLRQISGPAGAEATFLSSGRTVASTLDPALERGLAAKLAPPSSSRQPVPVELGEARYLATTEDLSSTATSPLQLVVLKSLGSAEMSIRRIDRLMLIAGLMALLLGSALMIALSRLVTRPIEELARGVRAFGEGDGSHRVPRYGTYEVRQLSSVFAGMRHEIQQANRALLESERLATIGRMASSVSHDLRHYLASVYANAEFLSSDRLSAHERAEIFGDIRTAVHGTTEMIDSLLIFSRTGVTMGRSPEQVSSLLERAVALVRAHPDAEGVDFTIQTRSAISTMASVNGKEIERAVCNLLLNACQSARMPGGAAQVVASVEAEDDLVVLRIRDNGAGVPIAIRQTLFDPFVSEGKQKGTGLGLTLAQRIAAEHGGGVRLVRSRPGETIFEMTLAREPSVEPVKVPAAGREVVAE